MRIPVYLTLILLVGACSEPVDTTISQRLVQLPGQWVVVNYWAKWCKPCIKEIPELNALDREYQQVTVLGVNFDGATGEELERQLQELGVAFPTLARDPAGEIGVARPAVLPTTFILDPSGRLSATLVGPQTLQSLARATGQLAVAQ